MSGFLAPGEHDCECDGKDRKEGESQREWLKRWMCMFHWMQTDYYQAKLEPEKRTWTHEEPMKNDIYLIPKSFPCEKCGTKLLVDSVTDWYKIICVVCGHDNPKEYFGKYFGMITDVDTHSD